MIAVLLDRKILLLVLLFTGVEGVRAQEVLTWKKSVEETLSNNPEIVASKERLNSADAQINVAKAGYFPQISGALNYQKSGSDGPSQNSSGLNSTSGDQVGESYGATLSMSQNLFNGFQDNARVDQAKAQHSKLGATYQSIIAKVSADLKNAYSSLLFAQNLIQLQEGIVKRRLENSNLVELRFKSGRENRGSLLLAQAYAKQATFDLLSAKNSKASALTDLQRVMGRDIGSPTLQSDIPLVVLSTPEPNFRELASVLPGALEAQADMRAAEASLKLARGGFYPTLSLSASTGKQDRDWFPEKDRWSVGASLSIPLFNGGKDYYGAQSASSSLHAARATLDNTTNDNVTRLRQAYYAYMEATEKFKVDQSFREATVLRAEIARSKYNNGLMTFEDWDLVESDLIAREKAVLQSERERVRTEAQWLQIQGRGVTQ